MSELDCMEIHLKELSLYAESPQGGWVILLCVCLVFPNVHNLRLVSHDGCIPADWIHSGIHKLQGQVRAAPGGVQRSSTFWLYSFITSAEMIFLSLSNPS